MADLKNLPEYYVEGDGDTTIFMLHGAYGSGEYFRNTAEFLAGKGYRVVVWNAPGYGEAPGPDDFTIEFAGEAARDLVEAEGTATNIIFGHSMGCLITPYAKKLLGDKVQGLILSAASPGFKNRTEEEREVFVAERLKPILEDGLTVAEYVKGLLKIMMAPNASGPLVDKVVEVVSGMKTETFVKSMHAIMNYDPAEAIAAIDVPTLLIAGEFDTATPPVGMEQLHEKIAGSEYKLIKDAGHYAFAEKTEVFHEHLNDFLSRKFPVTA